MTVKVCFLIILVEHPRSDREGTHETMGFILRGCAAGWLLFSRVREYTMSPAPPRSLSWVSLSWVCQCLGSWREQGSGSHWVARNGISSWFLILQGMRVFLLECELDIPWVMTWLPRVSWTSTQLHIGSLALSSHWLFGDDGNFLILDNLQVIFSPYWPPLITSLHLLDSCLFFFSKDRNHSLLPTQHVFPRAVDFLFLSSRSLSSFLTTDPDWTA